MSTKIDFHRPVSELLATWHGQFSLNGPYWQCCVASNSETSWWKFSSVLTLCSYRQRISKKCTPNFVNMIGARRVTPGVQRSDRCLTVSVPMEFYLIRAFLILHNSNHWENTVTLGRMYWWILAESWGIWGNTILLPGGHRPPGRVVFHLIS